MYRSLYMILLLTVVSWFALTQVSSAEADSSNPATVVLQLKWKHQFQFAGYYAAVEKGYYRDAGLNVVIKESHPGLDNTNELLSCRADFLVNDSSALLARGNGKPLVALAAIFQYSPLVILSLKESKIETPADLVGRSLMLGVEDSQLIATCGSEGIKLDDINILPHSWDVTDLVSGKVDAMSAYLTDAPFILQAKGVAYSLLRPLTYGIDFYGDLLLTTQAKIDNDPEQVKAFQAASLKGWAYAMAHQEELVDLILTKYKSRLSRQALLFEAEKMQPLIMSKLVELGHMNPGRWRHIANTYIDLGLLPADFSLDGFLYYSDPKKDYTYVVVLWLVLAGSLMITLVFIFLLRKMVCLRTEELNKANKNLVEQSNQTSAIINGTTDAIFIKDTQGKYVVVNDEIIHLFGRPRSEIVGKDDTHFFTPEEAQFLISVDQDIMQGSKVVTNEQKLTTLGRQRVYLTTKGPLYDNLDDVVGLFGVSRDITKDKQAEKILRESEERFRKLSGLTTEGIILHKAGVAFDVNKAVTEMFGYRRVELIGTNLIALLVPYERHVTIIRESLAIKETNAYEVTARKKDGTLIPVEIKSREIEKDGETYRATAVRDLSERKQAEALLWENELRLRQLFDEAIYGIAMTDPETGLLVDCNSTFARLLKRDKTEIIGKHQSEFHAVEEQTGGVSTTFKQHLKQASGQSLESRMLTSAGEIIDVEINTNLIDIGKKQLIQGFFKDITVRKQVEEERQRLSHAIEQSAEIFFVTDVEGTIQYVNAAFEKITGYTSDETIGQNPRILKSGLQDDEFYRDMWATLKRGETWHGRMVNKRKDGTLYTEEATISPVCNDSGVILNYVAVKRDITQEIKVEEQLRQSQKMEAVGQLAGGIAHDFNNLLAIINANLDIIKHKHKDRNCPEENLDHIKEATGRAKDLVSQILAFSRQEKPLLVPVDLSLIIDESIKLLRPAIPATIEIITGIDSEYDSITADTTQLQQVIINLCNNAVHAMNEKGVLRVNLEEVTLATENVPSGTNLQAGSYAKLAITDTGSGMDTAIIDRVFEPFFTTKDVGSGTGMGLSVVHGIVEQHGGFITVKSTPGQGTTFNVFFPTIRAVVTEFKTETAEALPTGTENILFVDDEECIADTCGELLECQGYKVTSVTSSVEALEIFKANQEEFDLVFADQTMPELSGAEFAAELLKIKPDILIVLCSGYSAKMSAAEAKGIGIREFCMKPMDMKQLAVVARRVLDAE